MTARPPRKHTQAELEAFDRVCERLDGFDSRSTYERVDGQLTALAAGPRLPPTPDWLTALFDDTFDRAFADPDDRAVALAALQSRLDVLRSELDPEALLNDPDDLRLEPLMAPWSDEDRQAEVDAGRLAPENAGLVQEGAQWALGFLDSVEALGWEPPAEPEGAAMLEQCLAFVDALLMRSDGEHLQAHLAKYYPKARPIRDDMIVDACLAVQDLRLVWIDFAARTPPRRVEPAPGRNDPCPCGSGKKFKKCHGAAVGPQT